MFPGAILTIRLRAASGQTDAKLMLARYLAEHGSPREAVRQIAAAAKDGSPEAQARLGLCYLRGHGVPASPTEARYWLEQSANSGDLTAQIELASLAMRGIVGPYARGPFVDRWIDPRPDPGRAAEFARRAAEAGSAEAKALLALILSETPRLARAPTEATDLYREAAEAGSPLGQFGHAMALVGDGTAESRRQARDLLTKAASTGLPAAHFMIGALAEADGTEADVAARHYRLAAEHGHTGAKTRLGLALLCGRGIKRNTFEGETWLRRAAIEGDPVAAAALGDFHSSPERDPANPEEAARWYRHAARLGHAGAARALAHAISTGAGGEPDPSEIATWLRAAIERGETTAWTQLGRLILSRSFPRDQMPTLHAWLQQMIREDQPEAGFYVGVCINCGLGTPPDDRLARRYYLWAAAKGVIEAMAAAAEMLLHGRGGGSHPDTARAMFEYAGERGHAGSLYALGVMTGDDRVRATEYLRRAAALGHEKARRRLDQAAAAVG